MSPFSIVTSVNQKIINQKHQHVIASTQKHLPDVDFYIYNENSFLKENVNIDGALNFDLFKEIKTQSDLDTFIKNWYENPLFGKLNTHPNFKNLTNKKIEQVDGWKNALSIMSIGTQPDLWARLELIKCQVTFITGSLDEKYFEIGHKLNSDNKINHISFQETGHNCHFENPEKFIETLREMTTKTA